MKKYVPYAEWLCEDAAQDTAVKRLEREQSGVFVEGNVAAYWATAAANAYRDRMRHERTHSFKTRRFARDLRADVHAVVSSWEAPTASERLGDLFEVLLSDKAKKRIGHKNYARILELIAIVAESESNSVNITEIAMENGMTRDATHQLISRFRRAFREMLAETRGDAEGGN